MTNACHFENILVEFLQLYDILYIFGSLNMVVKQLAIMKAIMQDEDLRRIALYYMLHGSFMDNIGLFRGKMGLVLFYFLYSRYTSNPLYEDFAVELFNEICEDVSYETPIGLRDGLCGIGWGILFLHKEGFIDNSPDELLADIDARIMEYHLLRMKDLSLETGFEGIALYVSERLSTSNISPFDNLFIEEFNRKCLEIGWSKPDCALGLILLWMKQYDCKDDSKEMCSWQDGLLKICDYEKAVHY